MRRARNQRGAAAVELLLALPVLLIFGVAMFDFAKGYRARTTVMERSRARAWSGARHDDYGANLMEGARKNVNYSDKEESLLATILASLGSQIDSAFNTGLGDAAAFAGEKMGELKGEFEGGLRSAGLGFIVNVIEEVFDGWPSYLIGQVPTTRGTASTVVSAKAGIMGKWLGSQTVSSTHVVALKSYREAKPDDPEGWVDPFARLWNFIKSALANIAKWIGEAIAEAVLWAFL